MYHACAKQVRRGWTDFQSLQGIRFTRQLHRRYATQKHLPAFPWAQAHGYFTSSLRDVLPRRFIVILRLEGRGDGLGENEFKSVPFGTSPVVADYQDQPLPKY